MDLKRSPHSYDLLTSHDQSIICLNCEVSNKLLKVGLLGIKADIRSTLTAPRSIDLFSSGSLICRIELLPEMKGDRNGYIPNTNLKIL
jgi:hypothetical protein